MRFFNLKFKKFVEIPDDKVNVRVLKNGARLAQATTEDGHKVAKLLPKQK